jgi:hypothetical protein
MIEVQSKPPGIMPPGLVPLGPVRGQGSVPAVLPPLLPEPMQTPAALYDEAGSLLLIVLLPTAFWCGVISGITHWLGGDIGLTMLSCVALVLAGFLLIVRASLTIDRSN